jgi:(4-(4-[2-(gamma-L-glutamylamino)ethyl]phenoxymethyl)furan-2-yl)methanamine synthase
LVNVIGLDIGGAYTKAVFLCVNGGKVEEVRIAIKYFPVWKEQGELVTTLRLVRDQLNVNSLDILGVTMTAELSDAYKTKREGVQKILASVEEAFPDVRIYVLTVDARMEPLDFVRKEPFKVASANWAATGWLVAQQIRNCVVVDIGSTSTSIIPVVDGKVSALGKTDLKKLMCGELVYTGSLRTNVATIVDNVPIKEGWASVASELFATTGDVHLILGNISKNEFTCETADGREKTKPGAFSRLARLVCADTEMLTEQEILKIAKYIYEKQILQVASGLSKVYSGLKLLGKIKVPVVVTGLGKDFLARKAALINYVEEVVDLDSLIGKDAIIATPAFGVALMAASKLEGESV